ncbi:MAG: hypothetical protein MPF33_00390 [Candidatus Aramenus sp.]|jgi:hypothetical protein|nr:hypothetical protein [Candidatus Aramenus sp.]
METKLRVTSALLLALFGLSLVGVMAQGFSHQVSYTVYYSRYDSIYRSFSMSGPIMGIHSGIMQNYTVYMVSSENFSSTDYQGNVIKMDENFTTYVLDQGSLKQVTLNYTVEVKGGMFITVSSSPQLIRVLVSSDGRTQVAWAGFLSTAGTVQGYTYINYTGTVILQYANGTSIYNVSVKVSDNTAVKGSTTVDLLQMSVAKVTTHVKTSVVVTNVPRKYEFYNFLTEINGTNISSLGKYNVTLARFNGTLLPAIVWNASAQFETSSLVNFNGQNFGISNSGNVNNVMIAFYGVNGTLVAVVREDNFFSQKEVNNGLLNSSFIGMRGVSDIAYSSIMIIKVNGVLAESPLSVGVVNVNGNKVVVVMTDHYDVETTANVSFTHEVFVNTLGVLVKVYVNSTGTYVVVFKNNETGVVKQVKPVNVTNTTVSYNGATYVAQKVEVNATGYVLFNVTPIMKTSHIIVVEVENGNFVALNSSDYFIVNNTIEVFTDPAQTYYVLYSPQSTATSTTSTTTTSQSTAPSTTTTSQSTAPSTSTTSTVTTTSTSSSSESTSPSPSASTTPATSSPLMYAVIGIIVVIIAVLAVVLMRRK